MNDSDDIITGMVMPPTDADQLTIYNKKNKLAKMYIWSCTSNEWHYLVEDKPNRKLAYLALKMKVEASSFSHRIALCKAFYGCVHSPDKHVDILLQSVTKAKAQALERRGSKTLVRVMLPKEGMTTEATGGAIQLMTTTVTIVVIQATLHLNASQICH